MDQMHLVFGLIIAVMVVLIAYIIRTCTMEIQEADREKERAKRVMAISHGQQGADDDPAKPSIRHDSAAGAKSGNASKG